MSADSGTVLEFFKNIINFKYKKIIVKVLDNIFNLEFI